MIKVLCQRRYYADGLPHPKWAFVFHILGLDGTYRTGEFTSYTDNAEEYQPGSVYYMTLTHERLVHGIH